MTLVVIVNVVLAVAILAATVAQLAHSITGEHRAERRADAGGSGPGVEARPR